MGWIDDNGESHQPSETSENIIITKDLTTGDIANLYAQWGSATITNVPSPGEREGYRFIGWFDASGTKILEPDASECTISQDTTLYGRWEKDLDKWVTITFDSNDSD